MTTETKEQLEVATATEPTAAKDVIIKIADTQVDKESEPINEIHDVQSLFFMYNENKIGGPYTKNQIISSYIENKIKKSAVWVKQASDDSDCWYKLEFPQTQDDGTECEIKNKKIKELFPDLYKLIMNVFLGKIKKVDIPSTIPKEAEEHSKYLWLLNIIGKAIYIIAMIIFIWHNWIICCISFVIVMPIAFCIRESEEKSNICIAIFFVLGYTGTIIGPVLTVYFILSETEIYDEIQSWMIGYIAWGIISFTFMSAYGMTSATQIRFRILDSVILLIVGVEFDIDFTAFTSKDGNQLFSGDDLWARMGIVWLFPSLASLLPAAIVGFIANFILEEKFVLKCSAEITHTNLCFSSNYGCCDIISSHDFESSYTFLGGLASNILAVWAIIRIIGYLMVNASPSLRLYAKRKK